MTAAPRLTHLSDSLPDRCGEHRPVSSPDWLARAAALTNSERAEHLRNPEPTRSTTVAPELTEAMLDHRRCVDRCARVSYAMGFAFRHGRFAAVERLVSLSCRAQVALESSLEAIESLIGGGR